MTDIRAVTYDCWSTLIKDRDWERAMTKRAGAVQEALEIDEREARRLLDEAWRKHDEAAKRLGTFGPGRMAAYCLEAHRKADDERVAWLTAQFEEATMEIGVEAVDGARETLQALERADIRRGLVCDTGLNPGRVVRKLLEQTDLLGYLETVCFSDEVGMPKPSKKIFATALRALGVRPSEAIHVGDLRRTDVAGARAIGMRAARFRGAHDDLSDAPDAAIVLDDHRQLLELLGVAQSDDAAAPDFSSPRQGPAQ